MVKHVSIRDKRICLVIAYLYTENAGSYHHPELAVLFYRELSVLRNFITD